MSQRKSARLSLKSSLQDSSVEILESSIQDCNNDAFAWIKTPKSRGFRTPKSAFDVKKLSDFATGGKYIPASCIKTVRDYESPVVALRRNSRRLSTPKIVQPTVTEPPREIVKDNVAKSALKGSRRRNVEAWVASSAPPNSLAMEISPAYVERGEDYNPVVEDVLQAVYGPNWRVETAEKQSNKIHDEPPQVNKKLVTTSKKVRRKIFDALSPESVHSTQTENKKVFPKTLKTPRKRRVSIVVPSDDERTPKKFKPCTPASTRTTEHTPKTPRRTFLASLSVSSPTSVGHPEAQKYKIHYAKMKDELCVRLYKLYNAAVFENRLPEELVYSWNPKMRGTAGFCYNKRRKVDGKIVRTFRLEFAPIVLDRADRLRDTLIHELCHGAAWILDGVVNGHGAVWRSWAEKAKARFPELPAIGRCHNYEIITKFTYRCVNCGYSINRQSKSIDVDRKRCGYCKGKMELLYNKKKKGNLEVPDFNSTRTLKAPNQYALFVKENYSRLKAENPALNRVDIMKLISSEYRESKNKVSEQ